MPPTTMNRTPCLVSTPSIALALNPLTVFTRGHYERNIVLQKLQSLLRGEREHPAHQRQVNTVFVIDGFFAQYLLRLDDGFLGHRHIVATGCAGVIVLLG